MNAIKIIVAPFSTVITYKNSLQAPDKGANDTSICPSKKNKITRTVKLKIYFSCSRGSETLVNNCLKNYLSIYREPTALSLHYFLTRKQVIVNLKTKLSFKVFTL